MLDDKDDLKWCRFTFIEACAYYIRLTGINGDLDRLVMTERLAEVITQRYKMAKLYAAIGNLKYYEKLLTDGMQETLPDFEGDSLDKSMVLQYNFRSLLAAEIRHKEMLCNPTKPKHNGRSRAISLLTSNRQFQMAVASATASAATTLTPIETVAKTVQPPSTPSTPLTPTTTPKTSPTTSPTTTPTKAAPISAPHDILKGFTVYIKPDVHLDETVPICARDQHLLYNIFGDKWTSPVVISAYTAIKGQTGFMHNWSHGDEHDHKNI